MSHAIHPRIGLRILAEDNAVFGVVAYSIDADVGTLSDLEGVIQVDESGESSDEAIARLLHVSWLNGNGDPRTVELDNFSRAGAETIRSQEQDAMALLDESDLYWVETNPAVVLVAIGRGMTIILVPLVQGFFFQLGSEAAEEAASGLSKAWSWLRGQVC